MSGTTNDHWTIEDAPLDQRHLRSTFGRFATGVTIITATAGGDAIGCTANSFASVSLEPPLVSWNLARSAQCFEGFEGCDHFAVNILAFDQQEIAIRFATRGDNKFAGLDYQKGHGEAPLLPGAIAQIECAKTAAYDGGDHVIYLGKVLRLRWRDEVEPLVFYAGGFRELLE